MRMRPLGAGMKRRILISLVLLPFFTWSVFYRNSSINTTEKNAPRVSTSFASTTAGNEGLSPTETAADDDNSYYQPSPLEQYAFNNAEALGYTIDQRVPELKPVCPLWKDPSHTTNTNTENIYAQLQQYLLEIKSYEEMVDNMNVQQDLREQQTQPGMTPQQVCQKLQRLSESYKHFLSYHTKFGYIEPLVPPLRNPGMCLNHTRETRLSLRHLVMDYVSICKAVLHLSHSKTTQQKQITMGKPPRTILIDMGASLVFGGGASPALKLIEQYQKFGIHFDHIYGYELKEVNAKVLFQQQMPAELMQSYHWMNVGVSHVPGHKLNPWTMVLRDFTEDDFIVVKMDIDHSPTELPLANQLRNDTRLQKLVDHFYFEQHVIMNDMLPLWGGTSTGSVYDSMKCFRS